MKIKAQNTFSKIKFILLTFCLGFSSWTTIYPNLAVAQVDVSYLQSQIDERNKKIQDLNIEIAKYQDLASKANSESLNLKQMIASLEADRKKLSLETQKIGTQIESANLNIKQLASKIETSKEKIKALQDGLEKSLREISQNDNSETVVRFLKNQSFSDYFGQLDAQAEFNRSIQSKVADISSEKKNLEDNKSQVEKTKKDLADLKSQLSDKQKTVEYTKTEQQKVLEETKSQEKSFQKLVEDRTVQKNAFEKEIFDYEAKIKFTLDPNSIPLAGSSPLAWPTDDVYVTQRFGKTSASGRLYVSGSHNGVDFKATIGTPIKAVADGIVGGTGDTDKECRKVSFGRWIMIKHNNGLASVYGHLSVISVNTGDTVKVGQIIGYSGNTGYSTGPHLHLGVYVGSALNVITRPSASCPGKSLTMPVAPLNAYLDPMLYLPPYNN